MSYKIPGTPANPVKPPYISQSRYQGQIDRPTSKEIFKIYDTNINNAMSSVINTGNPSEILTFFQANMFGTFVDVDNNNPIHLIINIDESKLNQKQKIDIIKQLIQSPFNISIDIANNNHVTPLHIAIKKQYEKIVLFLLEYGADAKKINGLHQNALHMALIPNIQLCEKKLTPDLIINLDPSLEDKNTLYNKILSILYNGLRS